MVGFLPPNPPFTSLSCPFTLWHSWARGIKQQPAPTIVHPSSALPAIALWTPAEAEALMETFPLCCANDSCSGHQPAECEPQGHRLGAGGGACVPSQDLIPTKRMAFRSQWTGPPSKLSISPVRHRLCSHYYVLKAWTLFTKDLKAPTS